MAKNRPAGSRSPERETPVQAIVAVIGALAALVAAGAWLGPYLWPTSPEPPASEPEILLRADTLATLSKGEHPRLRLVAGRDTLVVQLMDVETLKGRGSKVERGHSGHEFNKQIVGRRTIGVVLTVVGIDTATVMDQIMTMETDQWVAYLEGLGRSRSDRIKDMPLARLRTSLNHGAVGDAHYARGETIDVPHPRSTAIVEVREVGKDPSREWVAVRALLRSAP
jgi:hypothetical protein